MITYEKLLRGGYRATLGQWSECGRTKKAATDALLTTITNVPSNIDPIVEIDRRGNIWILWFEGRNWAYTRRQTMVGSCTILNTSDKRKAHQMMLEHIAQWLDCTSEE